MKKSLPYKVIEWVPFESQIKGRKGAPNRSIDWDANKEPGTPGGPPVWEIPAKKHLMPAIGEGRFVNIIPTDKKEFIKELLGLPTGTDQFAVKQLVNVPLVSSSSDDLGAAFQKEQSKFRILRTPENLIALLNYKQGAETKFLGRMLTSDSSNPEASAKWHRAIEEAKKMITRINREKRRTQQNIKT